MSPLLTRLWPADGLQRLFVAFVLLLLAGGAGAVLLRQPALLLPGLLVVGLLVAFIEWRWLYYLLFFLLAVSVEIGLPGGFSMDVPSEPLMLALTACVGLALVLGHGRLPRREWRHPLLVVLALMLIWTATDTFFSTNTLKSVKYLAAKVWYLVPFVLGTLLVVRRPADTYRFVAAYAAGACCTVLYVVVRHATKGFSFAAINWALHPFYRNHVSYATTLALIIPFVLLGQQSAGPRARPLWWAALGLLTFGLLTSFTRASILSLPVAGLYYLVMRLRLTRAFLLAAALSVTGGVFYFVSEHNYMLYAPDFEKTVFNGKNFTKHLEATYNMQDVSGMERVYRWVAAARMIADKPLVGSGPATFYPEYKRYTVKSFRTYVSENPEKSTTHNYFLLQLAEQGLPGFILFVLLVATALLTAEDLYHRARHRPEVRRVVLAATLSLVVILFHLTLNELVEVDKIGSVFFVCLALLVRGGSWLGDDEVPAVIASGAERNAAIRPLEATNAEV